MIHKFYGITLFGFFIAYYLAEYLSKKFFKEGRRVFYTIFYAVFLLNSVVGAIGQYSLIKKVPIEIEFYRIAAISVLLPLIGLFLVFCIASLINPKSVKDFFFQNKKLINGIVISLFIIEMIFAFF